MREVWDPLVMPRISISFSQKNCPLLAKIKLACLLSASQPTRARHCVPRRASRGTAQAESRVGIFQVLDLCSSCLSAPPVHRKHTKKVSHHQSRVTSHSTRREGFEQWNEVSKALHLRLRNRHFSQWIETFHGTPPRNVMD